MYLDENEVTDYDMLCYYVNNKFSSHRLLSKFAEQVLLSGERSFHTNCAAITLTINPSAAQLLVGGTAQFTAQATLSQGASDHSELTMEFFKFECGNGRCSNGTGNRQSRWNGCYKVKDPVSLVSTSATINVVHQPSHFPSYAHCGLAIRHN